MKEREQGRSEMRMRTARGILPRMRFPSRPNVLAAIAIASLAATPVWQTPRRVVLHAARVWDPGSGIDIRDAYVAVDGKRIALVATKAEYKAAPQDSVIELGESTLLPGLIDAHVHLSISASTHAAAESTLKAGFTTVADLGAITQAIPRLRDSIDQGLVTGPRVLAAGMWVGLTQGVCDFQGIGLPPNVAAIRARVQANVDAGADLIKACVSGWPATAWQFPDSAELDVEKLGALVNAAHAAKRKVVAHVTSRAGVRNALATGVDGFVHAAYLDDSLISVMKAKGVWMAPTLASLTARDTSAAARALIAAVQSAQAKGVTIVFGTDAGVIPHGRNAREAAALLRAGLTPADVIRAATTNAARALGIADSVGSIKRGMSADFVAVRGDPSGDVRVLEQPVFVMLRGTVAPAYRR
jgi:imidazolonepropionase-like amidohydrolase